MPDRASRKQIIAGKRRGQILRAATEVFSRKGYAATIPEIARLAGLAAGTIYIYYPSKRGLFIDVIKNLIITTPLLKLIDKIPQGNIDIVLKNILGERLDLIKNPVFVRMPSLIGEVLRDPELKALWLKEFLQPFLARIEMGYRMMAAAGRLRRLDPAVATRAVGGAIVGFLILRIMEGDASPLKRVEKVVIVNDIVDFVLHGLLAGKTRRKKRREVAS